MTEEHKAVRKMVRDFVAKEIIPNASQWDKEHRVDYRLTKKMGDLGILGICIPENYGGAGMDYISAGIACEELEYGESSFRVIMSVHLGLNSCGVLQWGNEEQKQKYLKPQAQGKKMAAFCLTEPGAGSDVQGLQSTAVKKGDKYILNGTKAWISLATVADNYLVFAYTDKSKKAHGLSAFIVEKSFPGVTSKDYENKLGVRSGSTGEVNFNNVEVPAENLVGEEGEGFKIAMSSLDNGRFTVASGSVGLAKAALDASLKYCNERKTFGKEIGQHQLVQQHIANMVRGIESAELLVWRAGWMKNQGLRNTRETALAKWVATTVAQDCANSAIQIHGAYGFSGDYPVERFWRNSRGAVIYEGTNEIHTIMQGEYALGYRKDKPLNKELPPYPLPDDFFK